METKLAKMTALGIFHTPMGDYLVFPCGCDGGDNLNAKRQKATRNEALPVGLSDFPRVLHKPVWMTFETDYIFEDRPHEVEVED